MAKNISDTSTNVTDFATAKRGRGRPKGSTKAKAPEMTVTSETVGKNIEEDFLPVTDAEAAGDERAPAFGHNQPDAGVFLTHVNRIRAQTALVKTEQGKLRDMRTDAKGVGLVLKEVNEAIKDLESEQVDIDAREERRRLYHEWLAIPFERQRPLPTASLDPKNEAKRWKQRGDQDGRLGKIRQAPTECPPEHIKDYLAGHEAGQEMLMKHSPLTAAAFRPKDAWDGTAEPDAPAVLTLGEEHFLTGTMLEDANMKTILPEHIDAVMASPNVVVVYGSHKRILREPEGDGFYLDTGEPDVEVTEPEPVETAPSIPTAADLA